MIMSISERHLATHMYMHTPIYTYIYIQGRSQEFSFTEARLKGKGASNVGVWGAVTQYIKVTFSILLNSYDNTMA